MFSVKSLSNQSDDMKKGPEDKEKRGEKRGENPHLVSCSERERIMKQCIVPNWNLSHQRQEQVDGEEGNRTSHVHNPSHLVPMSDYEVAELTWENGQLAMHGLSGLLPSAPTKPTWRRPGDTLESIVHQATFHPQNMNSVQQHDHINEENLSSIVPSSGGKWTDSSGQVPTQPAMIRKWLRSDSDQCGTSTIQEDSLIPSECASASATFCREDDTTMLTRDSFKSSRSLKTKKEKCKYVWEIKGGAGHWDARRQNRVAAIHNQSERKRRDRINQKMKALQKLVPNANKTDKASMLDEVIEYLKQLQAQVEMISGRSNVPQMMMSIGMQHHFHQMSLLARMGMGVGLGMGMGTMDMSTMARSVPPQSLPPLLHPATVAAATPPFVPPPFLLPPPQASSNPYPNASVSLQDQYRSCLAQSMNIDLYNKMAALYQQQVSQTTQATSSSLKSNNV